MRHFSVGLWWGKSSKNPRKTAHFWLPFGEPCCGRITPRFMNTLQLNLNLLSNRFYEYVWRSPELFLRRIDSRLQKKLGWRLPIKIAPAETNAITWVRESAEFHTRLYIFNYWTEHYGVERVPISIDVRASDGTVLGGESITLDPRETRVVEAGPILSKLGIATPFVGSFVLRRTDGGAGTGIPLKLLHEFYGERFAASIHEYGTVDDFGYRERQVGVIVCNDPDVEDVEIGLVNCERAKKGAAASELIVRLYDHSGRTTEVRAERLAPGQSTLLSLTKLIPDWRSFVGDKPGNISILLPSSIGRPLVFHRSRSGSSYCLNHLTGDKSRPPFVLRGDALKNAGLGPVFAAGVVFDAKVTTAVSLIMNWGFNLSFEIEGQIFDEKGKNVGTFGKKLRPWETWVHDLSTSLSIARPAAPWVGSVLLYPKNNEFVPTSFDANMEYMGPGWRQSVNLGSSVLNLGSLQNIRSNQVGRTKNFLRVRHDDQWDTDVIVVNHSSRPDYDVPSQTTFRLISGDGLRQSIQTISIPARGVLHGSISSLFPDFAAVMGNGSVGTLHVRDTNVKLLGIHMLRNRRTGALSGDHYFGG